ncbi:hypothetical protein TRIUR3_03495 [Triticum urartu]|uniref:Disease resistance R13L4/SHOC-2-like LRR domain-containing protein n=1 Tax=Triticum urartu TaxID=4572 RepID=M7ZFU8_TRIUA|nr:hypothetical protein TRIUR3_03495 [Triticum urartu]
MDSDDEEALTVLLEEEAEADVQEEEHLMGIFPTAASSRLGHGGGLLWPRAILTSDICRSWGRESTTTSRGGGGPRKKILQFLDDRAFVGGKVLDPDWTFSPEGHGNLRLPCSAGGYVYNMRTLSAEDSTVLLKKKVSLLGGSSPDLEDGSAAIVHKCDGHPLALVSVANHLLGESELTGKFCKDTSSCLGSHMDKNTHGDFTKLRQVLSIDESNDGKSKTCKPHGIMHQFMLHKSMSCNFVTSFGDKNRRRFRHLVMENHTNYTTPGMDHAAVPTSRSHNRLHNLVTSVKEKFANISTFTNTGLVCKQLRPRSLTIFGGAGEAVSDLTSCELLRVLDLKECVGLNEEHLGYIYKLLHLKYLTLGSSVCNLSVEMERLHCLETLDVRNTQIETLPVEVINLPHLAHLFGKIKLNKISSKNGKKFMQGKSNLQTLAGVVVDSNSGFPELMVHMKKLTKIKLWCEISSTYRNYTILSEAIHRFVQAGMGNPVGDRSLSLHINDCSKDLLHHHQVDNTTATSTKHVCVSSLKLQGSLSQFIQFVTSLRGLKELCLTSTNLTRDDLSTLFTLKLLVYLKLVEVHCRCQNRRISGRGSRTVRLGGW